MKIIEIINQIVDYILHFDVEKFFKNFKPVVIIIAVVTMIVIIIGALFSLIPQF